MNAPETNPRQISKSERTRADLLLAAREVISRDGLVNTRIVDIVQHAGRSSGLFYSYFKNKRELFASLVEEFGDNLSDTAPDPGDYTDDPAALVRATVQGLWHRYKEHRGDVKGLFETALTDDEIRAEWQKLRKAGIRSFAYRIRKQQAVGLCQGMDPDLAGSALLGLFEFGFFNWEICRLDYPDADVPDDQAIETLVTLLQSALQLAPGRTET
ncbi:TetR/AcrR family transcriptional regulator [Sphingomonas sp. MG17]|uniref:TetR/AcrR family transcriptional regulator n=1 Tax=Sphingomonas tagetis TaxID=2949092 RepID=A0A9X2HPR8_9SPHN|nr:TetR/AcrR family transcriptional regulator [Sphingomonas tagetis]MCP3730295.1 TetR/AcrR family transcriptional regulator [Sphingomonas tagetis]